MLQKDYHGIVHDLNNLLAHLNLGAELLREASPRDNPQFSRVMALCQGVKLVTKLARRLTDYEHNNVYQNQLVNLNQLLSELLKFLQYGVMENIEIKTFLSPSLKLVEVDPIQFERVIVNLTTNAIEAMPKGGKLTIETMNVTLDEKNARENVILRPGCYVTTTVSDTGHGIDSITLNHLFEQFFTTKKYRKAKGLGLSIVSRIITQHGGDISVSTKLGEGTAFKIYLPSSG